MLPFQYPSTVPVTSGYLLLHHAPLLIMSVNHFTSLPSYHGTYIMSMTYSRDSYCLNVAIHGYSFDIQKAQHKISAGYRKTSKSLTTSDAMIRPATDGTNATEPGTGFPVFPVPSVGLDALIGCIGFSFE